MARSIQVLNHTRNSQPVTRGQVADNLWTRFRGLMGKRSLPEGYGLYFPGESAIHSFFMRIPIDVAYLDRAGRVVHVTNAMPPWRVGPLVRGARNVLELPVGTLERTATRVGDFLEIRFL
ncbi:MAG: hypothetical protein HDKAJFGB_03718 [Anaerolineae bacterium]|nr:hypothetical protein [Anaerolineae bacterium]RIK25238.1 MAG: DUF192 domain-containing protein [Chloroflexota bacterium]